jgi:hypothetical protein
MKRITDNARTGTDHIYPLQWDPLIFKFCMFFGGGEPARSSWLARAWQIPETAPRPIAITYRSEGV